MVYLEYVFGVFAVWCSIINAVNLLGQSRWLGFLDIGSDADSMSLLAISFWVAVVVIHHIR